MTATTLACVHFHGISTDAMNHAMEVWNILGGWDYYDLPYFRSVNYYNLPRSTTLSLSIYIYMYCMIIYSKWFSNYIPWAWSFFVAPHSQLCAPGVQGPSAGSVLYPDFRMIFPCPIPFCWITNGTLGGYHGNILRMWWDISRQHHHISSSPGNEEFTSCELANDTSDSH